MRVEYKGNHWIGNRKARTFNIWYDYDNPKECDIAHDIAVTFRGDGYKVLEDCFISIEVSDREEYQYLVDCYKDMKKTITKWWNCTGHGIFKR